MKIAFATQDQQRVHAQFGWAKHKPDNENDAKRKFNSKGAFSREETSLITARLSSVDEAMKYAKEQP